MPVASGRGQREPLVVLAGEGLLAPPIWLWAVYVTGVGGTTVLIGLHGQRLNEYGWQSDYSTLTKGAWAPAPPGTYSSGGGGGTGVLFKQPFYQKGKVPASISKYYGKTPMRAVPDIAMPADPNSGFEVGQTQVFPSGTFWAQYRIGGTSLASPLMAGVVAVADQFSHRALGFINPLYYHVLGTKTLHDIVAPTSTVAQVRTDYTNFLNGSQGKFYRLQTVDGRAPPCTTPRDMTTRQESGRAAARRSSSG